MTIIEEFSHQAWAISSSPSYVNFCLFVSAVALIISEESDSPLDYSLLTAALLLDVVGKTDATVEEVSLSFGHEVGQIITELACESLDSIEDKLKFYVSCNLHL